jgi:hypothetical protein
MKHIFRTGFIGGLLWAVAGFSLLSMSRGSASRGSDDPINVFLETEKTAYQVKEPVVMRLTVLAPEGTNDPAQLVFPSAQRYDFIVTKEGREIWYWSRDRVFAMMMDQMVLKPGESLRYTETWDQRDNEGAWVPPGSYRVVGVLKASPEVVSEQVVVDIKVEDMLS